MPDDMELKIVRSELRRSEEALSDARTHIRLLKEQLNVALGGAGIGGGCGSLVFLATSNSSESALSRSLTTVSDDNKNSNVRPLSSLRHIPVSRLAIPVGSRAPPSVCSSSARSDNGDRRSEASIPSALRTLSHIIHRAVDPVEAEAAERRLCVARCIQV